MAEKISLPRVARLLPALLLTLILAACGGDVKVERRGDSTAAKPADTGAPRGDWIDAHGDSSGTGAPRPGASHSGATPGRDSTHDASDRIPTSSRNITVATPAPDDVIKGDLMTLRGTARTFENAFAYRVTGGDGAILAEGHSVTTGEMGHFNPYVLRIPLKAGYNGDALLEVFQFSAKDGSEVDKVSIPIRVLSDAEGGVMRLRVFFTNFGGGAQKDCRAVAFRTREVRKTVAVAESALNALLAGPDAEERREGYGTEIPAGTRLRDITIENGRAVADFSAELKRIAGSCAVTAAREQIERTLRQFPTVKSVTITVEGSAKEALQP